MKIKLIGALTLLLVILSFQPVNAFVWFLPAISEKATDDTTRPQSIPEDWHLFESAENNISLWYPSGGKIVSYGQELQVMLPEPSTEEIQPMPLFTVKPITDVEAKEKKGELYPQMIHLISLDGWIGPVYQDENQNREYVLTDVSGANILVTTSLISDEDETLLFERLMIGLELNS